VKNTNNVFPFKRKTNSNTSSFEERTEAIKARLAKIDRLMAELKSYSSLSREIEEKTSK